MNISADWFEKYGMKAGHDERTIKNVLSKSFIRHAAQDLNIDYVSKCVEFQTLELTERKCSEKLGGAEKPYGIVDSGEGFYWMIACDLDIEDAPQDGPFDSREEAEKNVIEYMGKLKAA
ncbi:MAG: hypothetical protein ABI216_22045 [Devosia sp.]